MLAAKDENRLSQHSEANLKEYVEGGGSQTPPKGKQAQWSRSGSVWFVVLHSSFAHSNNVLSRSADMSLTFPAIASAAAVPNYFMKAIGAGDPDYIPREPLFGKRFYGAPNNKPAVVYQLQLPTTCTASDRAVFYSNSKFPWIIGAHRYRICKHNPTRPNVAGTPIFVFLSVSFSNDTCMSM